MPNDKTEAADAACRLAFGAADHLAGLLDRYDGDSGDDADAIDAIRARIDAIAADVRALLGTPRVRTF